MRNISGSLLLLLFALGGRTHNSVLLGFTQVLLGAVAPGVLLLLAGLGLRKSNKRSRSEQLRPEPPVEPAAD